MKKKLEAELISIAHRILKLRNKSELIQLHQETQKLYEKLSVLLFVEENFGETKPTIGYHEMLTSIEQVFEKETLLEETEVVIKEASTNPVIEVIQPTEETQSAIVPDVTEDIVEEELLPQVNETIIEIETEITTDYEVIPTSAIIPEYIEDITSIELSSNDDKAEINEVELLETESTPEVISEIENETFAIENEVDEEEDLDEMTLIEEAITLTTSEETTSDNAETLEIEEPVLEAMERPAFEFDFKTIEEIEKEKKEKINQLEVVENIDEPKVEETEITSFFTPSFEPVKEETDSPKSNIRQISLEELLGVSDPNPIFERVVPIEKKEEFHFEPFTTTETPKVEIKEEIKEEVKEEVIPTPIEEVKTYFKPVFETPKTPEIEPKAEIKIEPKEEEEPESRFSWLKSKLEPKIVQKPVTGNRVKKSITFGLNDKIAFEKHLFHGSSEDLNRVISQLSTYDTLHEAVDFIETMVKPDYNYWEGKDEYVKRFMEIVEKRFA